MNSYFQSHTDYFWQWEDSNEVLAIPQGNTIAYKALIIDILERLAPQGLPPFGALLLALIATNASGAEDLTAVRQQLVKAMDKAYAHSKSNEETLNTAITFLHLLTELPQAYKTKDKRILLFQTIFENCHNIQGIKYSKSIIDSYKNTKQLSLQTALKEKYKPKIFTEDFRTIALLCKRFPTVQSILDHMAKLIDIAPETLVLEETAGAEPKPADFIQELVEEPKTFQVGSLIRHIWSGLHIPFHNTMPSQQPMGGVSDISNKGDFSRLLVSEFANDDDLLLLRLANQEALYLNREIPPSSLQMERILLIDASLLNWGTPKCIALALMVAIAKHPKTDLKCRAFAVGARSTELKFGSVHDLIEAVQIVAPTLHPALGIAEFYNRESPSALNEIFLISNAETLALPAMQKLMADLKNPFSYIIHTDKLGHIEVYKRQNLSKKQVQTIQLPLHSLWKKEPKGSKKTRHSTSTDYSRSTLPLLVYPDAHAKKILHTAEGSVFQITRDRNLLQYRGDHKGWSLVYEQLPFLSGAFAMGRLETGEYLLLMYNVQNRDLSILNLHTGASQTVHYKGWKGFGAHNFMFHHGHFYYLMPYNKAKYLKIDIGDHLKITYEEQLYEELKEAFDLYEEGFKKRELNIPQSGGLLKNVHQVFINQHKKLVINTHQLDINVAGSITLSPTNALSPLYAATKSSDGMFVFPNGSSISLHRSGMLILRDKDSTNSYEVILKHVGQKRATLLHNIEKHLDLRKSDAEKLLKPQTVLVSRLSRLDADTYIKRFKTDTEYDCEIIAKPSEENALYIPTILQTSLGVATHTEFAGNPYFCPDQSQKQAHVNDTKVFWLKHIVPFIRQITEHGTPA